MIDFDKKLVLTEKGQNKISYLLALSSFVPSLINMLVVVAWERIQVSYHQLRLTAFKQSLQKMEETLPEHHLSKSQRRLLLQLEDLLSPNP